MGYVIILAADASGTAEEVYEIVSTVEGLRAFWTADCDLDASTGRFGFPSAQVDLHVTVVRDPGRRVRMHVTDGFPDWVGSWWEWSLGPAGRSERGTGVLFRHEGFGPGYGPADVGYVAQTWAQVMDRLVSFTAGGSPQPLFPAHG